MKKDPTSTLSPLTTQSEQRLTPPPAKPRGHEDHDQPHNHDDHGHEHALETLDLVRIALVAVAVVLSWLKVWDRFASFDVIALVATVAGGYPIFREAVEAVFKRRMTMELSMTIALGAACAIGEFFTALVIVLFVLIAEVLEGMTVGRGRRAIKDLLDLLPRSAVVRRGGLAVDVTAKDLRLGDIVVVKPGSRIPVDGVVASGHSFVDQATITGESLPVEKAAGALVFAGTINQSGALEVETTKIGQDTAFGKIVEAVENAEKSRAPIQKTADRLAGYLVYFALGCALLTFLITRDARSTISVVIVAGACGIAAGTPLAILGAIGRAARKGAIVKGGLYIEALGTADTAVFDKTGTLTLGKPEVIAVHVCPDFSEADVLAAAAMAEKLSEHPLGQAILRQAASRGIAVEEPSSFTYQPGKGIVAFSSSERIAVGNRLLMRELEVDVTSAPEPSPKASEVLVARGSRLLGSLEIADVLRPDAAMLIRKLKDMGLRTVLMTGDAEPIANAVGRELGLDEVYADLLPTQKVDRVKALRSQGRQVVMLGDGVNDAPALMEANVGVAMGSGADVARESANIVLLGNDLGKFAETVETARRCRRIIMTNFAGTLVVDVLGVALAAFGFLNPLLAAFIHVASELAFILNSARLLPSRSAGVRGPN